MIPLISSRCKGPMGICQLPRTWWKALLRGADLLDPAYPACSRELDRWCLDLLGLDHADTLAYLQSAMPTYLEFEAWILERRGGQLDEARIVRWNTGIERRVHVNPAKIAETYGDIGYDDRSELEVSALLLNSLQDWALFHTRDYAQPGEAVPSSLPPLISSLDTGPLGILQLPRTWLKVLLRARGLLHPDYPDFGGGLDRAVIDVLGLDHEETVAHLREYAPGYLEFEAWIRERTRNEFDWKRIAEWHRVLLNRVHPDHKRAEIHATIGREDDGTIIHGVMLNHLEDWAYAHRALTADA